MDLKDVEKLAELARISLSEGEKTGLLEDMKGILEYVKQIEDMNIEGGEPEYKIYNVWREDAMMPQEFSREQIIGQFPDAKDGFLKVKKIL